jgi:hypothetical protein
VTGSQAEPGPRPARGAVAAFFGPLVERRTYRALAYLLLSLPFGVAWFSVVVTMLATGFALMVTLTGPFVIWLGLRAARGMTAFDLGWTERLVGLEMPRVPVVTSKGGFPRRWLGDHDAWVDAAYLMLRLPLGIADFTVAVSFAGSALFLLSLPIIEATGHVTMTWGAWQIDSQPRAWLFVPGGVLLLLVTPHVINGTAALSARVPRAMIGRVGYPRLRTGVLAQLDSDVPLTASEVFHRLHLFYGASADCRPRKVYAVLSQLERAGLVRRAEDDPFDVYSLTEAGAVLARRQLLPS